MRDALDVAGDALQALPAERRRGDPVACEAQRSSRHRIYCPIDDHFYLLGAFSGWTPFHEAARRLDGFGAIAASEQPSDSQASSVVATVGVDAALRTR